MNELMMKAKYNVFFAWCLMLASGLWTACSDDAQSLLLTDLPEEEEQPLLGEGQFIVCYGTSGASSARGLSEQSLPANKRISSLHYFVYEKKTGELIKQRQIRGIGPDTDWPIDNRKDMPWELRQDLQDTLVAGYTYRILFIANADSTLFKKADGTVHPAVMRDVENYASAKIVLPEVPFSDHNMYYLWEDSLTADAGTTVKRKDVKLQRLVTRTDVERKRIDDYDMHLNDVLDEIMYNDESINAQVDSDISDFCDRLVKQFDAYKIYNDLDPHAKRLAEFLKTDAVKSKIKTALKNNVINSYKKAIQSTEQYKQAALEWGKASRVEVSYQPKTRTSQLGFNRQAADDSTHSEKDNLEVINGRFSIVGFPSKSSEPNPLLNKLKSITFLSNDSIIITLNGMSTQIGKDMNCRYKVVCNPIADVIFEDKEGIAHPNLNFYSILDGDPTWEELKTIKDSGFTLFKKIEDWVFNFGIWEEKKYGEDFKDFTFPSINLPDLNKSMTLYPSWTVTLVPGNNPKP